MGLIDRLKSLLGLGGSETPDRGRRDTSVTVERDARTDRAAVDAESEAAVKDPTEPEVEEEPADVDGAAAEETDAAASTDSMVQEHRGSDEAAEQGEAAGPETDESDVEDAGNRTDVSGTEPVESALEGEPAEPELEEEPADVNGAAAEETDAAASTDSMVDEKARGSQAAEVGEAIEPESDGMDTDAGGVGEDVEESDAAEGEPVDAIKGIGPAYAERLKDVGIRSVDDLTSADAEEVAERITVSEKRVGRWIERARDR